MKAPKVPSAQKTAAAQTAANISTAQAGQAMDMVNQVTPYGNLSYEQTGQTYSYYDPVQKKQVSIPLWKAITELSPEQQQLLQQEQEFDQKYNTIALNQTDRIGNLLSTPFEYNPGVHEGWANDLYGELNNENMARDQAALETQLVNKGLTIGSDAYNNEMSRLRRDQQVARDNFLLNSYATGMNTALTQRNQPINETSALISGGQITQPMFQQTPNANLQGTDVAGIMMANAQMKQNQYGAMMGGLSALGGAGMQALGGWAAG